MNTNIVSFKNQDRSKGSAPSQKQETNEKQNSTGKIKKKKQKQEKKQEFQSSVSRIVSSDY